MLVSYMIRMVQIYIYKNLHSKIFVQIFEMGMNYQDEILYISTRIKELRKERKLTVQELAYRCDMERSNLSRIEAGRTNLTVKTICSICNALSVNMRDVYVRTIYLYLYILRLIVRCMLFWAVSLKFVSLR